jgi:hypothetical protein
VIEGDELYTKIKKTFPPQKSSPSHAFGIERNQCPELLPNLWLFTAGLGIQRHRKIVDVTPSGLPPGQKTRIDTLSDRLYTQALSTAPNITLGRYVADISKRWNENYRKYHDYISFADQLPWDLEYLPPRLFLAQDSQVLTEFRKVFREIELEFPGVMARANQYDARAKIEFIENELAAIGSFSISRGKLENSKI